MRVFGGTSLTRYNGFRLLPLALRDTITFHQHERAATDNGGDHGAYRVGVGKDHEYVVLEPRPRH